MSRNLLLLAILISSRCLSVTLHCDNSFQQFALGVDLHSSTGELVQPALARRGVGVIAIQSREVVPSGFADAAAKIDWSLYAGGTPIIFRGNVDEVVSQVRGFPKIVGVVTPIDGGVALATLLGQRLGLAANDPTLSEQWVHKGEQFRCLRARGIAVPDTVESDQVDEILTWIRDRPENRWPVVIKPPKSAGSDGVQLCHSEAEVRSAFKKLIGKVNGTGFVNETVLAQPFVDGDIYAFDGYVHKKVMKISDIWVTKQGNENGSPFVFLYDEMIPFEDGISTVTYVRGVLEALGIREGSFHAELKLTASGPVLIEIAARPVGGAGPRMVELATGHSQLTLMADAWLDEAAFFEYPPGYTLLNRVRGVYPVSRIAGTLTAINHLDRIRSLPSVRNVILSVRIGDRIERTIDFLHHPIQIELLHPDQSQIIRDYDEIKRLEPTIFTAAP